MVDLCRAPGDTPPTTHTARGFELGIPAGKFVSQPLAITGCSIRPSIAAKNVGIIWVETGIPDPLPEDCVTRQQGVIINIPAEAGWTYLGAAPATQTATGNLFPLGVTQVT